MSKFQHKSSVSLKVLVTVQKHFLMLVLKAIPKFRKISKIWKKNPSWRLEACNFTKINTPPWVSFTLFKLYKWYQIAQRTTYEAVAEESVFTSFSPSQNDKHNCKNMLLVDCYYFEKNVYLFWGCFYFRLESKLYRWQMTVLDEFLILFFTIMDL